MPNQFEGPLQQTKYGQHQLLSMDDPRYGKRGYASPNEYAKPVPKRIKFRSNDDPRVVNFRSKKERERIVSLMDDPRVEKPGFKGPGFEPPIYESPPESPLPNYGMGAVEPEQGVPPEQEGGDSSGGGSDGSGGGVPPEEEKASTDYSSRNIAKQFVDQLQTFLMRRFKNEERNQLAELTRLRLLDEQAPFQCAIVPDTEVDREVEMYIARGIEDPNRIQSVLESYTESFNYFQTNMSIALGSYELAGLISKKQASEQALRFRANMKVFESFVKIIPPFYILFAQDSMGNKVRIHGVGDVFYANEQFEIAIEKLSKNTKSTVGSKDFSQPEPPPLNQTQPSRPSVKPGVPPNSSVSPTQPNPTQPNPEKTIPPNSSVSPTQPNPEKTIPPKQPSPFDRNYKQPGYNRQNAMDDINSRTLDGMFVSSWDQ